MSGTFPRTDIFDSVEIRSENIVLKNIDRNNHYFENFQNQYWRFDITTVPLTRTQWGEIYTFLIKQNGPDENFVMQFPTLTQTSGTYTGDDDAIVVTNTPYAVGVSAVDVVTNGIEPSGTSGTLKAGDLIQFGGAPGGSDPHHTKVYQVREDVTVNGPLQSSSSLKFYPPLKQALTSSSTIIFTDVQFTVSLINDTIEFDSDENGYYKMQFSVEEDIN